MKRLKFLFTALLLLCGTMAFAHDFEVDGIYYNITDATNKTVELTYSGSSYYAVSNEYTGCVVIPESIVCNGKAYSVTSIGKYAFVDCSGLTSITIPNSVTSIGNYAFDKCSGLTSIVVEVGNRKYDSRENCNAIIETESNTLIAGCMNTVIPHSVTSIGIYAFSGCSGLTSITIPNSVTSIGDDAFSNCSGLTSIEIPNSVTSIGAWAFSGTAWYNNQPDGVVYAGNVLYKYKGTMPSNTSVVVKDGTLDIADYAFSSCYELTSIKIPNSVTSIGRSAFSSCYELTSIEIPNSVTSIGYAAFSNCYGLTSIEIPNSVTSIGEGAFSCCSGLTSIKIPNSVTSIGDDAFEYCSGLTSIVVEVGNRKYDSRENCNAIIETESNTLIAGCMNTVIPHSVTSIGNYAFSDCDGLTSIEIPNSVTSIGNSAFNGCSGLTSIEIPNSVTSIGWNAFNGCPGLTSVTIPNSVTSIGEGAFSCCSGLTSIKIPNSVTSIGYEAFEGCKNLTDVYCLATDVPSTNWSAFDNSYPENITLHVPAEAINSYKKTAPWSSFGNIVALKEEIVETPKCATPVIEYNSGKLTLECDTENAEIVTKITSNDFNSFYGSTVELSATYNISVYATAAGYKNSDIVNATLCWIECDCDANVSTGIIDIPAKAVLVTSNNGTINITCSLEGESVELYTSDAMFIESTTIENGCATIESGLSKGDIAIVKIGEKSIKIIID